MIRLAAGRGDETNGRRLSREKACMENQTRLYGEEVVSRVWQGVEGLLYKLLWYIQPDKDAALQTA